MKSSAGQAVKRTGKPRREEGAIRPGAQGRAALLVSIAFFLLQARVSGCNGSREKLIGDLVVAYPTPLSWEELSPGLSFARLTFFRQTSGKKVQLAALRIAPDQYRFRALSASELLGQPAAYLPEINARANCLLAMNASFYLPENYRPIGLIVTEGEVKNAWKRGAGSGLFWVQHRRAQVVWARDFDAAWTEAELALQAGPLIIEPGGKPGIYANTQKFEARTALGLDEQGRVVALCSFRQDENGAELSGLDLYELMQIMLLSSDQGGLGLKSALNLDGGVSASLALNHPRLRLHIRSLQPVPNALVVDPR
jgi:uncharacterized protein YigE (DUF2233 family)